MANEFNLTEPDESDSDKIDQINEMIRGIINGVGGTLTVNFPTDANVTPAPATVQAAYKIIVTGSAPLVTRNLVLPLKKHLWVVQNNNASATPQSVQVIGASGTGVTIPPGMSAAVLCDGTNFVLVGYLSASPPGAMVLRFSAESLTVSVGTSYFAFAGEVISVAATQERWFKIPKGGKLSLLSVISGVAPAGGSAGVVFTVRKKTSAGGAGAGADTALTCTVAIGATIANDNTHVVSVADGDEISVKIVEGTGYTGSMVRIVVSMLLTF